MVMEQYKVSIVILNYQAYWESIKCVESIFDHHLQIDGIIIVDNASKNDSYEKLSEKYRDEKRVRIVRTKKNMGFAKGNNIGIKVAKQTWHSDFIFLLNSDTVILENDYLNKIMQHYEVGTGVIQTSALRLDGSYTVKTYESYIYWDVVDRFLRCLFQAFFLYYPIQKRKHKEENLLPPYISGCDIMLTPDYFQLFEGLCPLTFLYGEEFILAMYLKKAKLKWALAEEAVILHEEMGSTPSEYRLGRRTRSKLFIYIYWVQLLVRTLPLRILQYITNSGDWHED